MPPWLLRIAFVPNTPTYWNFKPNLDSFYHFFPELRNMLYLQLWMTFPCMVELVAAVRPWLSIPCNQFPRLGTSERMNARVFFNLTLVKKEDSMKYTKNLTSCVTIVWQYVLQYAKTFSIVYLTSLEQGHHHCIGTTSEYWNVLPRAWLSFLKFEASCHAINRYTSIQSTSALREKYF